jgi:hypothetical protein
MPGCWSSKSSGTPTTGPSTRRNNRDHPAVTRRAPVDDSGDGRQALSAPATRRVRRFGRRRNSRVRTRASCEG